VASRYCLEKRKNVRAKERVLRNFGPRIAAYRLSLIDDAALPIGKNTTPSRRRPMIRRTRPPLFVIILMSISIVGNTMGGSGFDQKRVFGDQAL
jgi:hypothetical protein